MLRTIFGDFSTIYFFGLGIRSRVTVWVIVRVRVNVWERVIVRFMERFGLWL